MISYYDRLIDMSIKKLNIIDLGSELFKLTNDSKEYKLNLVN